ncbi:glutamine amidotransferase [Fontibacillus phaseoli]|uniref:Imidazole glycerol phosphate synthase subunit HisH n=1 Tax=Fontibacillus phaseoli TaxID=1416533 RepID=A0A369BAE1_9BACL|nr:imidazole glycerol phosphate synthase subunit HisH [Fontibacillus phaseoli]RCX18492.1 glutamine amidotransferase [Fontibacillus phaseoli]
MTIAIVDYGMGNLHSVSKAVERLGYEGLVTGGADAILGADGVLLPGVGAFGDAMEHLRASGLDAVVHQAAANGTPLLGICLGMQLLFSESEEHGRNEGLGILPGRAVRFGGSGAGSALGAGTDAGEGGISAGSATGALGAPGGLKVPHMGWNRLAFLQPDSPLLAGLEEGHVYFVHSYHVLPERREDLLAVTDYGHPVTAIVGRGNVYGMQFHPEKSGELGMALLRNFLSLAERDNN